MPTRPGTYPPAGVRERIWQSKLRHLDQEELLEVARECRSRGLPLSVIVADYYHWTAMGGFKLDPRRVPRPPTRRRAGLGKLAIRLMVSA